MSNRSLQYLAVCSSPTTLLQWALDFIVPFSKESGVLCTFVTCKIFFSFCMRNKYQFPNSLCCSFSCFINPALWLVMMDITPPGRHPDFVLEFYPTSYKIVVMFLFIKLILCFRCSALDADYFLSGADNNVASIFTFIIDSLIMLIFSFRLGLSPFGLVAIISSSLPSFFYQYDLSILNHYSFYLFLVKK